MADAEQINADQLAFWNGAGGRTWVERQAHTDVTLSGVMDALVARAAPRAGEHVLDIGCGCGAATLDLARAVAPGGRVDALDISGPMLEEARRRAQAAGIGNVDWRQADAASAQLAPFDLLVSAFGVMFFGDPVAAFAHMGAAARPDARLAFVCWRTLGENPWMDVPLQAAFRHVPPRPRPSPGAPGMFAFAEADHIARVLTGAGWSEPVIDRLDLDLDIAAGLGLDQAVDQSTRIGMVNGALRGQSEQDAAAAVAAIREDLAAHADGDAVRLPAAMWLVSTAPA